jgi:hypothetical protein
MADEVPQYDESDGEEVEFGVAPPKRKRGANLKWKLIGNYDTMADGLNEYSKEKLLERGLIVGKVARSKTVVYNYSCNKRYCGCLKQYRITAVKHSTEVIEEETVGDHNSHELHKRNSRRGMSFEQNNMMEDAIRHNYKRPMQVIDFFATKHNQGIVREGKFAVIKYSIY